MGWLLYGSERRRVVIDDNTLAHLQIVIVTKLRRNEGFIVEWTPPGGGATTCFWLSPSIPLTFGYDRGIPSELNREWLELLFAEALSVHGLRAVAEPARAGRSRTEAAS